MWNSKMLIVAAHEFSTAVKSKAFLIGAAFMPIVVVIMMLVRSNFHAQNDVDAHAARTELKFAVLDHTQVLYGSLASAARQRNQSFAAGDKSESGSLFLPVLAATEDKSLPEVRAALAAQVRGGELFAFVEIPASVMDTAATAEPVLYHSGQPAYDEFLPWVRQRLDEEVRGRQLRALSIDPQVAERLTSGVRMQERNVFDSAARKTDASVKKAEILAVPFGLMGLLFMVALTTTPPLFNSVMEERAGRISEVMLGSVTPFELMAGKLIGNLGISLLLATIYMACGYFAAVVYGYAHLLSLVIFLAFAFFLVIAIALFGSLFIAVGSVCDDVKDAQSVMMPMMLLMVLPLLMVPAIVKAPGGSLTTGLSLFPTTAPFVMPLRLALPSPVPIWQVGASIALTSAFTIACVWAAGKIFRTGILVQGKSLSLPELWRLMRL